jgi:hypothetical protein
MEVVTSWMQDGIVRGIEQGAQRERSLVLLLLEQRVGALSPAIRSQMDTLSLDQIEALAVALLNFATITDLEAWLQQQ